MAVVVNIRCPVKSCKNRVLLSVSAWPADGSPLWADPARGVWAERCPKHKEIRTKETIADADARRAGRGLPPVDAEGELLFVSWSTLRPSYLDSTHRGRAVDYFAP
jgi:hypothetical protein